MKVSQIKPWTYTRTPKGLVRNKLTLSDLHWRISIVLGCGPERWRRAYVHLMFLWLFRGCSEIRSGVTKPLSGYPQLNIHHFPEGEKLPAEYLQRDCFVLNCAIEIAETKTSTTCIKQMVGTQMVSAFCWAVRSWQEQRESNLQDRFSAMSSLQFRAEACSQEQSRVAAAQPQLCC